MPNKLLKTAAMGATTSGLGNTQYNRVSFGCCVHKEFPPVTGWTAESKFFIVMSAVWALADFPVHCYAMQRVPA